MAAQRSKFVIQPFKHNQQMDADYADRTWQTLHDAICEIHKQNASGLSFEELYRNAYNMVLHKFGDKLYNGLTDVVTRHLQGVAQQVQAANDDQFLPELKDKWDKHKLSSIMIRDILMYMVRHRATPTGSPWRAGTCRVPRLLHELTEAGGAVWAPLGGLALCAAARPLRPRVLRPREASHRRPRRFRRACAGPYLRGLAKEGAGVRVWAAHIPR